MTIRGTHGLDTAVGRLGSSLDLPCGLRIKNRLAKAAMSDSLGDGRGQPTQEQVELYRRWARGGVGLSMIGEVQVDSAYPEKPGNLVLDKSRDVSCFRRLASAGNEAASLIWPQLSNAGALAHRPISRPAGPSALSLDGLSCGELSLQTIQSLPAMYAKAAERARTDGFTGVEIHAGHGFLLSQFLSPLFNRRTDGYGGSVEARCRLAAEVVRQVRVAVGPEFGLAVKINSSDQLEGGLTEDDSLTAIELLGGEGVDLFDISGGTYFPGAPSSSDREAEGPYFLEFARRARRVTRVPLMLTGGFKTYRQAANAVERGDADLVGLARALVLNPELPERWLGPEPVDPEFPKFSKPPPGGVTAWYTMRIGDVARHTESEPERSVEDALTEYMTRDEARSTDWTRTFDTALPAE